MFGNQGKPPLPQGGQPPENEQTPKKRLFEKDFIILSEFSEQVGPVPVQFIPDEKSKGAFDASHFSVRIMTSDYQTPSGKLVGEDTQVLLSEKQDQAYAYVHYFSLNDINARGYVRQYCFSYITSRFSKLVDNFDTLKKRFCEVTSMLKCSNLRVFKRDLEHHLADLSHTMAELTDEGWTKIDDIDNSQLYLGFDFTVEDVPERDVKQVKCATIESSDILELLKLEMARPENQETWLELKRLIKCHKQQVLFQIQRDSTRTPTYIAPSPVKKGGSCKPESPDSGDSESVFVTNLTESYSSELTNSTSSDVSQYQPQRVMTHTVQRFERRLRPLEELSPKAYMMVITKLKDIQKFFSRSELCLEMEKEECLMLDPWSSLLTIGRVPMINFLQNFHRLSNTPKTYQISCKNTWGQPSEFADGEVMINEGASKGSSGFDTTFMEERLGLNRCPLYIDLSHRTFPSSDSFVASGRDYDSDAGLDQSDGSKLTSTLTETREPSSDYHSPGADFKPTPSIKLDQDEDGVSRGSHGSGNYVTPETGLSPSSSIGDHEGRGDGEWAEGSLESNSRVACFKVTGNHLDADSSALNKHIDAVQKPYVVNNHPSPFKISESNLDFGTRLPTASQPAANLFRNGSNLQGDYLGGKTTPSVTTSVVAAHFEPCTPDMESISLSLPASSVGINSDPFENSEVDSIGTEDMWGSPNLRNDHQRIFTSQDKLASKVPQPVINRELRGIVSEESHSAGSGVFDGPFNNTNHSHNTEHLQPSVAAGSNSTLINSDQDGNTCNISTHSISSEERHTPPVSRNKYRYGSGTRPSLQLPRQPSLNFKGYPSPDTFYSPMQGPPDGMLFGVPGNPQSPGMVSLTSQLSQVSQVTDYRGPSLVEIRGKGRLPMVSSIDLVECDPMFQPGRGMFGFCKDSMSINDLFYCLLHGRPLVVIGTGNEKGAIRRLIRLLWMFVPGHSSKQQVITWQDTPLDVKDLSRVKLMGLSCVASNNIGPHLKRYVSYWNVSTGKISTPQYEGDLLKPITSRTRHRKNEAALLAHTLSVLLDISMKAFVYYHAYCTTSSKLPRERSRRFLQSRLDIKGCDVDIIEHLVDIIREQQLAEWKDSSVPSGTPHNKEPVMFKVHKKHCRESTSKTKRLLY